MDIILDEPLNKTRFNCRIINMEFGQTSSSSQVPAPLFPAYSSDIKNQEEKKDWLYNSSFTESAFKQVCSQLSLQNAESYPKEVTSVQTEIIPDEQLVHVKSKRKSHLKKKYKQHPDASTFTIPESESILSQIKKKTFIEETGLSLERAFLTDSTRDPDNLMFECFERTKIAKYHSNFKIPIGLSPKELVFFNSSLPKRKEKAISRYFSKSFLKIIKAAESEKISLAKKPLENISLNYIPVSSPSNCSSVSNRVDLIPNFVSVSSSWKLEQNKKEEPTKNKNTDLANVEFRDQIVYYNKKLSEEPNNIEMWLDFLDFQEKIFFSGNIGKSNVYSENNLIEKKLSILDKALKYNPKNVSLNVMKLKLNQNLYNPDKLTSMWEDLIFFNPNNAQIWLEYLLYSVSNLTTFNVNYTLKLYNKCIRTLSNVAEGEIESHQPSADIVPNMLEIFNQLSHILKSSGYIEKVIAAYQALIEFNLFCDPSIEDLSVNEKIACLEPFWDSGALRIGEKNAIGWFATVQQKKIAFDQISTDSDLNNMEDEILSKNLSLSETWLEFEKLREIHHWLPWKPNPEYDQTSDDIDDPDRTVSFDDVSKFLFHIKEEEYKFLLVMQFINFLGFNPHSLGCNTIINRTIHNPYNVENFENISYELNCNNLIHHFINPFPFTIHHFSEEKYNFIHNIFSQVEDKFSSKYKILCTYMKVKFKYYFTVQLNNFGNKTNTADLKKFIKGILKKNENRNCLLLWFEYIFVEWLNDKSSALKTFHTLLLSSTSAVSVGSMPFSELWYFVQSFIELCLNDKENSSNNVLKSNEVVWILIQIASKEKYVMYSNQEIKPTMILKATSGFKNALEKELNSLASLCTTLCYCLDPYIYSVINCAKCFAYFQYFSHGNEAALQVYEYVISFVNTRTSEHLGRYILEQIHIAKAKMLNFHTWNSTTSLKPLQMFLHDSVSKYPHNSKLLHLLVKLRSASSVISPTRRFLSQILRNYHKSHPVTWFFTLIAEFAICSSLLLQNDAEEEALKENFSGLCINWRIRSLYEKMLQCDTCAHVSILWRSYLKFEVMTKNPGKAKSVFHRGLQNCGWSKELLMDVVEYFPDELKEIIAFMTEKQIRIHTPLEEVILLMEHAVTHS